MEAAGCGLREMTACMRPLQTTAPASSPVSGLFSFFDVSAPTTTVIWLLHGQCDPCGSCPDTPDWRLATGPRAAPTAVRHLHDSLRRAAAAKLNLAPPTLLILHKTHGRSHDTARPEPLHASRATPLLGSPGQPQTGDWRLETGDSAHSKNQYSVDNAGHRHSRLRPSATPSPWLAANRGPDRHRVVAVAAVAAAASGL